MSSYIDLILIIFLIYSVYQGYQTGFITALSKLLFIIFGVLLSIFLAIKIKGIIYPGLIASPYLAIGIIALTLTAIFRKIIQKLTVTLKTLFAKTDLLWMDPVLGAALGLIKAYLIVFILISIIGAFGNNFVKEPIKKSKVASHIYTQAKRTTGFNLINYLNKISLKDKAQSATKIVEKTINDIKK